MRQDRRFVELRNSFRRFVIPMAFGFFAWYLLYVLLSTFARDFMGHRVFGDINVALILGLLQFVSTFVIARWYARFAAARLDPVAARRRAELEARDAERQGVR